MDKATRRQIDRDVRGCVGASGTVARRLLPLTCVGVAGFSPCGASHHGFACANPSPPGAVSAVVRLFRPSSGTDSEIGPSLAHRRASVYIDFRTPFPVLPIVTLGMDAGHVNAPSKREHLTGPGEWSGACGDGLAGPMGRRGAGMARRGGIKRPVPPRIARSPECTGNATRASCP